ncbi:hypothetical protein VaNZ11_010123 [Volvox africanus]|uniref:Uncharacterized protein n=1 Tax=Volvox africanus TaxID=51714 RepID=A0ABQ5SA49_9CHLO|nr:hypothetical protein VaNZ11_010123 [Volvox africanus]
MHDLPEQQQQPQQQRRREPQDPPPTTAGQPQGYPDQQSQPYQQQEKQQLRQAAQQTPDAAAAYPPYPSYLPYPQPNPCPGQETQQPPQSAAAGYAPASPAYPAIPPVGLSSCPTSTGGPQPYTPQPPQQQQPPPALGIPILGQSAAYVYQHPAWGPDEETRDSRFAFVAWLMFVLGFFMPIFWLVSVLLPCCVPGRHVRWAATASFLASLAYLIVGVVMGIVGHSMRGRMH